MNNYFAHGLVGLVKKITEHTAAEEISRSPPSSSTRTSRTTKSTGRQPNSSHPSTHGTPDASERPSRSSNTTLCHRTSAFSSATFGDQYDRLKDLLYPKSKTHTRLRDRLYPKSTTLLPLCLLTTDSVQWAHTLPSPTPRVLVSQFPPARLNELILQHPFMGWSSSSLLKQQHFPESGILLRTIRAYWSKRRVVPPVLFRTNYYSIEIPHGVTAISLTYHPHHAKLQVLPKKIMFIITKNVYSSLCNLIKFKMSNVERPGNSISVNGNPPRKKIKK